MRKALRYESGRVCTLTANRGLGYRAARGRKNMDVQKIAALAHLEITEEEVKIYGPQMAEIVAYVEQLNELETDDVAPAVGGLTAEGEKTGAERDDAVRPSLGQEAALKEAPAAVEGHFRVPKVL